MAKHKELVLGTTLGTRKKFTKASNATVYNANDLVLVDSNGLVAPLLATSTSNATLGSGAKILGIVPYYEINGTSRSVLNVIVATDETTIWLPIINTSYARQTAAQADVGDLFGVARIQNDADDGTVGATTYLQRDQFAAVKAASDTYLVCVEVNTSTNLGRFKIVSTVRAM